MRENFAIIGGGLTGLILGYYLSKKGHKVTIFEKEKTLGGLMGSFEISGEKIEKTYHHIFQSDKYIINLIDELGLKSKLFWKKAPIAMIVDNDILPFLGPVDLLKFTKLNIWQKIRLGMVSIYLQLDNNWQKYSKVLAYEWMKNACGEKAYQVIWEPLLKGKFGKHYKEISMAWMWARIHTRGNSGILGYLDGGFGQIIEKLEKVIVKNDGKIFLNTKIDVKDIENKFDKIITTETMDGVKYIGAIDMVFSTKQNLSKYYWHNINNSDSPFVAMIQQTNFVDKSKYRNNHIYYLGNYFPHDHQYFADDKKLEKDNFLYLKKIFPKFNKKLIEEKYIFKFKNAQHLVTKNYQPKIIKADDKVINLNFANIYPYDRGMNYAIREGEKIAKLLLESSS